MNSSDATRQAASSNPSWDLIQAQDLIDEISHLQRFLSIANTLHRETCIEVDPSFVLLLDTYLDHNIPEKLEAASDLLSRARKAIA